MVKLQHQPFETWMLSGDPLSPEQARTLQTHLDGCPACRSLAAAWSDVHGLISTVPQVKPAPGFASRWEARLARQRSFEVARKHRRQSLWMLVLWLTAAVIFLGSLIGLMFAISSPAEVLLMAFSEIASLLTVADFIKDLLSTLIRTALSFTPPILWLVGIGGLGLLSVLWVISLRQIVETWRIRL